MNILRHKLSLLFLRRKALNEQPKTYPWIGALMLSCAAVVILAISTAISSWGARDLNPTWWKEQITLIFTLGGGCTLMGVLLLIYNVWAQDSIESFWLTIVMFLGGVAVVGFATGLWLAIG